MAHIYNNQQKNTWVELLINYKRSPKPKGIYVASV